MEDLIAYTQFHEFYAQSRPETPYGRDVHERMEFYFDAAPLEKIYGQTEALLTLWNGLKDAPAQLSLITHHLKRLPRFPQKEQQVFDEIELFQIKKFLHNYRGLMGQLPPETKKALGFEYHSQALEELLNQGRQSEETFYIADEYSAELAAIRSEILEIDAEIQEMEARREAEVKEKYGFDFQGRPFLLVPRDRLGDYATASALLTIEPYDDEKYAVRPLRCTASMVLTERRRALAEKERISEAHILAIIAVQVNAEIPSLLKYRDVILVFDLAWGRARMAHKLALTRPQLHKKKSIWITKGRFAPCQSVCVKQGVPYTPLDACFESGATVIFGSNMGGKTVVLQTTAFLQLAAQAGLFVPAERFDTYIFNTFHFIGERRDGHIHQGLSGFGLEMQQLMSAWRHIDAEDGQTLLLMDEFARTTSSNEAEAILAAVLEAISQKSNTLALCSTHFHGLPRLAKIKYLRMAGLKEKKISATPEPTKIAQHMSYLLMEDDGKQSSDAIAVAQLLGLDDKLVQRAEFFFSGRPLG
jgi:DNA mismatch repair ATPase MutS